jgi:hypothetical protein
MRITDQLIDQAFADCKGTCGGARNDYFGLLYLQHEYDVPREEAIEQVAFGNNDYGIDGFYFGLLRRICGYLLEKYGLPLLVLPVQALQWEEDYQRWIQGTSSFFCVQMSMAASNRFWFVAAAQRSRWFPCDPQRKQR